MIRVLQVVNDMHRAGLETMLMNYYRNIDRDQIQFDFLTHRPYKSDYDDEVISLGGKVYYAPRLYPQNYPAYFKWMKQFFVEHPEYRIVHSHIDSMSYLPLRAAKKAGIPHRIAHSHNTSIDKDFKYPLKQLFRFELPHVANHYLACGQDAGKFMYGNRHFIVIPNAVEADKFYFNERVRKMKRSALGLEDDQFVVGHVGRLSYQKNHKFILQIFNALSKMDSKAVLLLVGTGEKEEEIRSQIKEFGLENKVMMLGNREDVSELYQAMDVFILPSLFEGIPVVGVESQFAGLPVFFSDKVPTEVKFSSKCQFLSLDATPNEWANTILKAKSTKRTGNYEDLKDSPYDIKNSHDILENYYLNFEGVAND
ncbi:glycosyltransferase family 1 protein [Lactobacillus delbrueckii subsp. bulgaricus]